MTTSAACGRPVQQAGLTDTTEAVPTLSTATKPTSASLRTWCEQVDWLIPSRSARSRPGCEPVGAVDTVCSSRTRVGSASVANHSAYVVARRRRAPGPRSRGSQVVAEVHGEVVECHATHYIDLYR